MIRNAKRGKLQGLLAATWLALTLFAPPVIAGELKIGQAALTKDSVERWVECFPRIKGIAITQALANGQDLQKSKGDVVKAVMKIIGDEKVRAEAEAAVREHGFKNLQEWLAVTHATAIAYARLKSGPEDGDMDKAAEKLIKKIDEIDFLSDKQKRKMEKKAREQLAESGALRPTPENLAVVRDMEKDLDKVVRR